MRALTQNKTFKINALRKKKTTLRNTIVKKGVDTK